LDPERPPARQYAPHWEAITLAQHLLGDYRAELASAQHGRRLHPDRVSAVYNETRALAALGQVAEVERRLDGLLDVPEEPLYTPAEVMRVIGTELRAHGHAAAADAAFSRALAGTTSARPRNRPRRPSVHAGRRHSTRPAAGRSAAAVRVAPDPAVTTSQA
jgi:hypothetical protein